MGKLATAFVDIETNLDPLKAGLSRAKTTLGQFAAHAKVVGRIPIGMTGMGIRAGAGLLGIGGAAGVGAMLFEAAKKAANLGESMSKVQTAFGKDSGKIIANSDRLAKQFGVVRRESLDAASAFGLMGTAAGLSSEKAAEMAVEMVNLGADLASFHNISRQSAFEKIRAGLAGEAEPLRPLGIMLSEDAVKAEALATGLIKVKRELTDQEKIIARISLIRKGAGVAAGDVARTIESPKMQLEKLMGDVENAITEFGKELQGAMMSGIKLAKEMGQALERISGKGAPEAIGEGIRSVIDTARVAVKSTPGEVADQVILSTGSALAGVGKGALNLIGLGDTALGRGFDDAIRDTNKVMAQKAVAKIGAKGLPAPTNEDKIEAFRKMFPETRGFTGPPAPIKEATSLFNDMADAAGLFNRGLQKAGEFLAGPGNFIEREKAKFPNLELRTAEEVRAFRPPPSRMFTDPAEFAQSAITGVLDQSGTQKEQVELLKDVKDELKEVKNQVMDGVRQLAKRFGLFPRGG